MAHTRFLYHIVFRTKGGEPLIGTSWENELYRYLGGIVKGWKGIPIEINGMPEHVHLLVLLVPCDFPAFMRELKANSSKWAKRYNPNFSWQPRFRGLPERKRNAELTTIHQPVIGLGNVRD